MAPEEATFESPLRADLWRGVAAGQTNVPYRAVCL